MLQAVASLLRIVKNLLIDIANKFFIIDKTCLEVYNYLNPFSERKFDYEKKIRNKCRLL